ncbi:uncharacterized protein LOC112964311 isoform X4 [Apteryx rowi]|uniref:uncharacterized protein LOC112964311 isoform X4 n=1 Tax=Apteryx rowi TaxID=308060 RepID=UPI000E1D7C04|nr:uncharacterized protein LOC112964311 isoform X4 [Apteryx rowi]
MSRRPSGHLTANAAPEPLPSRCSIAATAQSRHGWAAPAGSDRIWFRAAEEKNFTLRTARKTIEFAHARLFPCCKALPDALRRFVSPRGHRSRRRGSGLLPLPGGSGPRGPRAEIRPSDVLIYIQAPEMPYSMAMALSLLMYPVLKSLALQLHSAVTGSYIPGTHSIAFINCLNEQIAKDIARAIMDKKLAACVNILPKSSALSLPNIMTRAELLMHKLLLL